MAPWGRRHFALAYATRVEHGFPGLRVAHHADNWREIMLLEGVVYTNADSIYGFGPDWWRKSLGAEPHFNASGPGWVAVSVNPLPMASDRAVDVALAPGMQLRGFTFSERTGAFQAELCWQALRSPVADYSTFVHLGSVAEIVMPEQLVASSDHSTPVDGGRPPSLWMPKEIVCDAHHIQLPSEQEFDHITAGMYTMSGDGNFEHFGSLHWERNGADWMLTP
jgi:hypothetical protein